MIEVRCNCCNKKLAEGEFMKLNIKCPRCRAMNCYVATSPLVTGALAGSAGLAPPPER
ncbi:Com family DNA-binding transcriptional regulator [Chromobacterium vaccinii]|uniref:Com family DNA-binding transcriptional regulator n=1 Tax=Chromobacterium vaccinii TaxID=1108595 RepID=UPI003D6F4434